MLNRRTKLPIKSGSKPPHLVQARTLLTLTSEPDNDRIARELLKAVNSTSQSARKSWLFFTTLIAYLVVAVGSVTHADLLLNTPVKLPVLQIDVGLRAFFLCAPVIFIIVHFGVLLHHAMLTRKGLALNDLLAKTERSASLPHPIRQEVSSYFFTQNISGPQASATLRVLLRTMGWLTLNVLPLLLLLYFQVAFLPSHDSLLTSAHRCYVAIDVLVLILVKQASRRSGAESWQYRFRNFLTLARRLATDFVPWTCVLLFSLFVATLPTVPDYEGLRENSLDRWMTSLMPTRVPFTWDSQNCRDWPKDRCAFWLTAVIFEQPVNYVYGRAGWFSRNLVITDKQDVIPRREKDGESTFVLRGRDLRYATFDRSNFRNVDFSAADLSGASLKGTDLRDAVFECVRIVAEPRNIIHIDDGGSGGDSSTDTCPILIEANLSGALLTNKGIKGAFLQRIYLSGTDLRGFDLENLYLVEADLSHAQLGGANLRYSDLRGVNLFGASLEGSSFVGASLQGADFSLARLDGADLRGADLSGAKLESSSLVAADVRGAVFFGANLRNARVWLTAPSQEKAYVLTDIRGAVLGVGDEYQRTELRSRIEGLMNMFPRNAEDNLSISTYDRLEGILDPHRELLWSDSREYQVWQSLIASSSASLDHFAERRGEFLGQLGCEDRNVLNGIISSGVAEFLRDYVVVCNNGSGTIPGGLLPAGVTRKDVETIKKDAGPGHRIALDIPDDLRDRSCNPSGVDYSWTPAFYERVTDAKCAIGGQIPARVLHAIRKATDTALRQSAASKP